MQISCQIAGGSCRKTPPSYGNKSRAVSAWICHTIPGIAPRIILPVVPALDAVLQVMDRNGCLHHEAVVHQVPGRAKADEFPTRRQAIRIWALIPELLSTATITCTSSRRTAAGCFTHNTGRLIHTEYHMTGDDLRIPTEWTRFRRQ